MEEKNLIKLDVENLTNYLTKKYKEIYTENDGSFELINSIVHSFRDDFQDIYFEFSQKKDGIERIIPFRFDEKDVLKFVQDYIQEKNGLSVESIYFDFKNNIIQCNISEKTLFSFFKEKGN